MLFPIICLGLIGCLAAAFLWTRPHLLVVCTLLVVLFLRTIVQLTGLSGASFLDDALVALCVARGAQSWANRRLNSPSTDRVGHRRDASFPGLIFFALFCFLGLVSSLSQEQVDYGVAASGLFLATKGVLFGWAVSQMNWKLSHIALALRIGSWVMGIVILFTLANAVIPRPWATIFAVHREVNARYGLASLTGPFIHPFDLAFISSMAAIVALCCVDRFRSGASASWFYFLSAAATFLSFRRKDLVGLVVASLVLSFRFRRWAWVTSALMLLPIVLILGWEEISGQFDALTSSYFAISSEEARTVLTLGSIQVASNHFPLGAGFGRYGSRTAAVEYSPEYINLGFPTVYGLEPGPNGGLFLTDTSWPAVIGETGFIGAGAFVAALIAIAMRIIQWERGSRSPELRFIGACSLGWLVLTIFQSSGAAVFSSPPVYPFFFGLIGLGVAIQRLEDPIVLNTRPIKTDRRQRIK